MWFPFSFQNPDRLEERDLHRITRNIAASPSRASAGYPWVVSLGSNQPLLSDGWSGIFEKGGVWKITNEDWSEKKK
ncbi:MAG: hypothetical protein M0Z71_01055 [Nitrospiraceae bacterium]|nr:hypothetical protein [Nitrospiraceae bacterium]